MDDHPDDGAWASVVSEGDEGGPGSLATQGWQPDPFGRHEQRYFSAGAPTKLVRDGWAESYDDPDAVPAPQPRVALPPPPRMDRPPPEPDRAPAPAQQQRPRNGRGRLLAAAAVIAVAAIVGVVLTTGGGHGSGGRSSAGRPAGAPVAAGPLGSAAATTMAAGSLQFTYTTTFSTTGTAVPPISLTGTSNVASGAIEVDWSTNGAPSTVRYVGGAVYVQPARVSLPAGKHWVRINPTKDGQAVTATFPGAPGGLNPLESLQFLSVATGAHKHAAAETVNNVPATAYDVSLDMSKLAMGSGSGQLSAPTAAGLQALRSTVDLSRVPAEIWLDGQGRVVRFDLTYNLRSTKGAVTEVQSLTLSSFGAATTALAAPDEADTVPYTQVKDLLTGAKASP